MHELRGFRRYFKGLDARQRFLDACEQAVYQQQGSIAAAARLAGIHRSCVYRWCQARPGFRDEINAAFQRGHARWVSEVYAPEQARRRAARAQRNADLHPQRQAQAAAARAAKRR